MSKHKDDQYSAEELRKRAAKLARESAKGVAKELGAISKGVLSELAKIATLQKN
jgi:hypothetical protein